jgi:hypothetical protein
MQPWNFTKAGRVASKISCAILAAAKTAVLLVLFALPAQLYSQQYLSMKNDSLGAARLWPVGSYLTVYYIGYMQQETSAKGQLEAADTAFIYIRVAGGFKKSSQIIKIEDIYGLRNHSAALELGIGIASVGAVLVSGAAAASWSLPPLGAACFSLAAAGSISAASKAAMSRKKPRYSAKHGWRWGYIGF